MINKQPNDTHVRSARRSLWDRVKDDFGEGERVLWLRPIIPQKELEWLSRRVAETLSVLEIEMREEDRRNGDLDFCVESEKNPMPSSNPILSA